MFSRSFFTRAFAGMFAATLSCFLTAQISSPADSMMRPSKLAVVRPVLDCSALSSFDVSPTVGAPTQIVSAEIVDDGKVSAYCKVQIVTDNYTRVELRLPMSAWTQRLLFGGGANAQVSTSVKLEQFVTASWQDLGHRGKEDDFAENYQWRVNAGYRGMHLQVLAAKAILEKYYGQAQKFAYYNACSEPGREGMMEAQRFPEDFDGIGAGCPPINITINNGVFYAWNVLTNTGADGKPIITADKLPILHRAVLNQCDLADGVKDGIITDPISCHFNVNVTECKLNQDPSTCLTPEQVAVARELYRGAHDSKGGKMTPIGVLPGSELAWTTTIISDGKPGGAKDQTTTALRGAYYDPALPKTWQLSEFSFDKVSFDATTRDRFVYDATNPDLSGFAKAGHKLILWQALADTNVLPAYAILYYTALQKQMGVKSVGSFVRFYVLPGVYHCGGGDGPVISDLLGSLMAWVEQGLAPDVLKGVHAPRSPRGAGPAQGAGAGVTPSAAADLTRPIYPYPYTAKYIGTGDIRDAANYVRGPARPLLGDLRNWYGSKFYTADYQKWCTGKGSTFNCESVR